MEAWIVILANLFVAGLAYTTNDCPSKLRRDENLKIHGDTCYQFFADERKTFQDAQDYCKTQGGELATVKSDSVNKYLKNTLKNDFIIYYSPVWIGLKSDTNQFNWVDGSKMSYNNLDMDDGAVRTGLCVSLTPGSNHWTTFSCSSVLFQSQENRFICQYAVSKTPTNPTKSSECPVKSNNEKAIQALGDKCYYFAVDETRSFPKSEAFCEKYGGRLAQVKSKKINDFIQHHLTETLNMKTSFNRFWIGLLYSDTQKVYKWVDGTKMDYSNFDKYSTSSGKCVTFSPNYGEWMKDYCTDYTFDMKHFICQFDKISSNVLPTVPSKPKTTKIIPTGLILPTIPTTKQSTTHTPTKKGSCPVGTGEEVQSLDNTCYYFALKQSLTYNKAETFCEKYGGTLAMPKSRKINEFLQHHLHVTHKLGYSSKSLWIGLERKQKYQSYEWVDGTIDDDFKNFRTRDFSAGCVAISPTDGDWEIATCYDDAVYQGDSKNFICQF